MNIRSELTAAIWSWGTNTSDEIEFGLKEASEIGYKHFETTQNSIYTFNMNPNAFKEIMKPYDITPVSFYFSLPSLLEKDIYFSKLDRELEFVSRLGVNHITLQATWGRPEGGTLTKEQFESETSLFIWFCKKAKEYGIITSLHPHDSTWAMYENEIDFYMENVGSDLLFLCPDTAHLVAGGCDPVKIISKYSNRIGFTHLKDFNIDTYEKEKLIDAGAAPYKSFCELGKGHIDFKAIFAILKNSGYDGYLCYELDTAPVGNRESAINNYEYLANNY